MCIGLDWVGFFFLFCQSVLSYRSQIIEFQLVVVFLDVLVVVFLDVYGEFNGFANEALLGF